MHDELFLSVTWLPACPCLTILSPLTIAAEAELRLQREGQRVPNLAHPAVPIGGEELATVLNMVGEQRRFDGFEARDHVAVAESLDLVDFEAAAEVRRLVLILFPKK